MIFGGQTVTFVSFEDSGTAGGLGTYTQAETSVDVTHCRHRPMTFKETAEYDIDISTETWKTTAPPVDAVINAKADGHLRVDGEDFSIIGGPRVFTDMSGRPYKVTIISQKASG